MAHATDGYPVGVFGNTYSIHGKGVYGVVNHSTGDGVGVYGSASSTDGYGVYANGNLGASGLKTAVVNTVDYGWRNLYSMESPDVLFEDVNTAQLVNGEAVVTFDPVFAETVNLNDPYQVFLSPHGDCGLYVAETTPKSFTVRAMGGQTCSIAFDYRIIARRLGYENVHLTSTEDPTVMSQGGRRKALRPAMGNPDGLAPELWRQR